MKHFEFNSALGKPLVNLAYANGFPPETYTRALQPLFERYHVVSIPARPLWGDCEPESLQSWSQLGDDLLAGLDEITDQPVVGIGHSVGGIATLYAAIKRPERFSRLILIDPTMVSPLGLIPFWIAKLLGREPRSELAERTLRRRRTWQSTQAAYDYFRSKPLFTRWPDDMIHAYAESITTPSTDGSVQLRWSPEWEAQIYRTVPTDVWRLPRQIKQPTMVIHGELSDMFSRGSAITFRALKPDVVTFSVPNAGHLVPQEQPEQIGRLLGNFLS
ncbi:MAG: alpha/beta hydrolase [Chloroflexota bacterium]